MHGNATLHIDHNQLPAVISTSEVSITITMIDQTVYTVTPTISQSHAKHEQHNAIGTCPWCAYCVHITLVRSLTCPDIYLYRPWGTILSFMRHHLKMVYVYEAMPSPLPPPLPAAAVGTLLNLKNAYIQVNVTEVLFPSRLQPGLHTIRQFIIPDSMRCCNRLVLGNSYLFTGRFFGPLLFTRGCRDIFYYRHDNQTLLYSQNTATLAGFHPFSCWQIVVSSLETTSLSLSAEQGIFFSVCTSFFSILLPIIIIILHHYTYLPHFIVWCRTNHSPPHSLTLFIYYTHRCHTFIVIVGMWKLQGTKFAPLCGLTWLSWKCLHHCLWEVVYLMVKLKL